MVTRSLIKAEIDKIKDEYLTALYNIIKVFELPLGVLISDTGINTSSFESNPLSGWPQFIEKNYGCLRDDPLERAEQGHYEIREVIE